MQKEPQAEQDMDISQGLISNFHLDLPIPADETDFVKQSLPVYPNYIEQFLVQKDNDKTFLQPGETTEKFELKEWYFVNIWFPTKHYMEEIKDIIYKYESKEPWVREWVHERLLGTMKRLGILKRPYYLGKNFEKDQIQGLDKVLKSYPPEALEQLQQKNGEELFKNGSTSEYFFFFYTLIIG